MTNGERFAKFRKQNALTQQEVGEQLNVSAQAVSKWENNQAEPDISTLCKLADLYHTTLNELLGKGEEATAPVAPAATTEKEQNSVAKLFKKWRPVLPVLLTVLVAAALVVGGIVIFNHVREIKRAERPFDKFEELSLGMTESEVRAIMEEPHETYSTESPKTGDKGYDMWEEAERLLGYGYVDCEFWYYRDAQYEKNLETSKQEEEDLINGSWERDKYEYLPYRQIRLAFDRDGKLIEAYYNSCFEEDLVGDYGVGEKEATEVIFIDEEPTLEQRFPSASAANAKVSFEDGSVYLGMIKLKADEYSRSGPNGTRSCKAVTVWAETNVYLKVEEEDNVYSETDMG